MQGSKSVIEPRNVEKKRASAMSLVSGKQLRRIEAAVNENSLGKRQGRVSELRVEACQTVYPFPSWEGRTVQLKEVLAAVEA